MFEILKNSILIYGWLMNRDSFKMFFICLGIYHVSTAAAASIAKFFFSD